MAEAQGASADAIEQRRVSFSSFHAPARGGGRGRTDSRVRQGVHAGPAGGGLTRAQGTLCTRSDECPCTESVVRRLGAPGVESGARRSRPGHG